jgi:hypothetical protein
MQIQTEVGVGDLVYIISSTQETPLPNQTRGIIFSQIDEDWFQVYITWSQHKRIQNYPKWMLKKVVDFPQ